MSLEPAAPWPRSPMEVGVVKICPKCGDDFWIIGRWNGKGFFDDRGRGFGTEPAEAAKALERYKPSCCKDCE